MRQDRIRFSRSQMLLLYIGVIFLPTELRFGNSFLSLSVPELAAAFLFLCLAFDAIRGRGVNVPAKPLLLMSAFIFAAAVSLLISDDLARSIQGLRNIASIFLFIMLLLARSLTPSQLDSLYQAFLMSALFCALIGMWQSAVGVAAALSIADFSYMGYEQADRLSEIMAWKLNGITSADLIAGQKSVAIGLSAYSNNFGEMLVYASIACLGLHSRKVNGAVLTSLAMTVLFIAVVLSASRSAMLGLAATSLIYLFISANERRRLVFIALLLPAALSLFAIEGGKNFLGYDNFGTLIGRANLNSIAIDSIFSSVPSFLFGGMEVGRYYAMNSFSPHNVLLYISLFHGVVGLVLFIAIGAWILSQVRLRYASESREPGGVRVFYWASIVGSLWFGAYGMTWSVVESANSGILASFIIVGALSVVPARSGRIQFRDADSRVKQDDDYWLNRPESGPC